MLLAAVACAPPWEKARPDAGQSDPVDMDPASCAQCHPDHHLEWSGSMHAYAGEDPVFLAMNRKGQEQTNGALGNFCVQCHAPLAVMAGATTNGLNLAELPAHMRGITCVFCHSVTAVHGTSNNPLEVRLDGVMRGPFGDAMPTSAHRSAYSPLHDRDQPESASLCGACHDIVTPSGFHLERTYAEWQASLYAKPLSTGGLTCGACHMPGRNSPATNIAGAPDRRTHGHSWPGVDVALTAFPRAEAQRNLVQRELDTVLLTELCVYPGADGADIAVTLENIAAGHNFPSGATQDRRLWVDVQAFSAANRVFDSGDVPADVDVARWPDAQLWRLGHDLRDAEGQQTHDFWKAAEHVGQLLPYPTARLPSEPGWVDTHRSRTYSYAGPSPDRVELAVHIRPMGREVLEQLATEGYLDPALVDGMPTLTLSSAALTWTAGGPDCVGGGTRPATSP